MKIQIASDLHLEFLQDRWPGERLIAPVPDADVLVLAGDIASGIQALELFTNWSAPQKTPIVYVAGNHEFYDHNMDRMRKQMKEAAAKAGIHFLENDSVELDGVRFLGTTLWTDYKLDVGWDRTQREQMHVLERGLHDHEAIRVGKEPGRPFFAQDALNRHEEARQWLRYELAKPWLGKTVVVSHHAPHPLSTHPRFAGNPLNPGFISDLSEHLPGVDLWLHGHVHDGVDYQVGRCRVVANPAGYVRNIGFAGNRDDFVFENRTFDRSMLVEV